ncbi:hypothetical protein I3F58_28185 [Streptomyces sp. MUM 203J]|uniref:hypothetical protein n=1 Tax=Streptomyces sp. MUM 203J TaxID=2791990 RepID=UPI001F035EFB|nr:hypothetical protein [Streptomyces sp. MUM 203J]MCH0543359.1 hypothetical protein [Streptomyces sp. MUM 203J]
MSSPRAWAANRPPGAARLLEPATDQDTTGRALREAVSAAARLTASAWRNALRAIAQPGVPTPQRGAPLHLMNTGATGTALRR